MQTALPKSGDHVWIRQRRWRVERIRRRADVVRYDVVTRAQRMTFLAPFDRPVWTAGAARLRYAPPRQAIAVLAGLLGQTFGYRSIASIVGADAAILPHQLEPACAVIDGARRVLIADAVGLGKTIQAGIIIAEIVTRASAPRVLVIVPASLVDQWRDELHGRFRIACLHADRAELEAHSRVAVHGDNPWNRSGVWIASLDYLKQPHVLDALPLSPWDLVVVDEAHTACGDSDRHDACHAIASIARRVLLLTATPHDGDPTRFARLITIGARPDLDDALTIFRRTCHDVRPRVGRRVRWQRVRLTRAEADLFAALSKYEHAALRSAGQVRRDAAVLLLSVFRKRGLSTMGALAASLRRRLSWLEQWDQPIGAEPIQRALAFDDGDDLTADEREGLTADVGIDARQERAWLRRLLVLADVAGRHESKAARLVAFVRRIREPVIVFTEFRDSLEVLRRRFGTAVSVAALHGGLTPGARRSELARFLDGGADVLIATDVASLGLNLQTRARAIVNLELPWNPVRLEQRAGRVDRIGQARRVHITLLVARHDAEAPVVVRLAERAVAVREAIGGELADSGLVGEAAVRASVLTGAALLPKAASTPPWAPARRWVRPARVMARWLTWQRALRSRWRAPHEDGCGGRWTQAAGPLAAVHIRGSTTLICSVPILDGAGTIIESHLLGVRAPAHSPGHRCPPAWLESAAQVVVKTIGPRARRLARRLQRQLELEVGRERAIGDHLITLRHRREAQPGLFDHRERRAFEAGARSADSVRDAVDLRMSDLRLGCAVEVGPPSLVLTITDRP